MTASELQSMKNVAIRMSNLLWNDTASHTLILSDQIYDEELKLYQSEINKKLKDGEYGGSGGSNKKEWFGTRYEYSSLVSSNQIKDDTIYYVYTDGTNSGSASTQQSTQFDQPLPLTFAA